MKLFTSIISSAILVSATAAAYDTTYLYAVPAHYNKQMVVELPSGKSIIEVWAEDNEKISCTFVDRGTYKTVYEAVDTQRCIGNANLSLPTFLLTKVINNGDKDIRVRTWIHDQK